MNKYNDLFKKADASFNSDYEEALSQLKGLSDAELAEITPESNGRIVYEALIAIVEDAASKNISQAELITKVEKLGTTAKSIIARIPAIARLF